MLNRIGLRLETNRAVLEQYKDPNTLMPNEFLELLNCICDKRSIEYRERSWELNLGGQQSICGSNILGLFSTSGSPGVGNWLIAAIGYIGDRGMGAKLHAIQTNRDMDNGRISITRDIVSDNVNFPGLPFNFWTYRGTVFASNGFETLTFDGTKWMNSSYSYRGYERAIAFRCGCEYDGTLYGINTPMYPNEITGTEPFEDVKADTPFVGNADYVGTNTVATLYVLAAIDAQTVYLIGDANTALVTSNAGGTWKTFSSKFTWTGPLYDIKMRRVGGLDEGWIVSGGSLVIHTSDGWANFVSDPPVGPVNTYTAFTWLKNPLGDEEQLLCGFHPEVETGFNPRIYHRGLGATVWVEVVFDDTPNGDTKMTSAWAGQFPGDAYMTGTKGVGVDGSVWRLLAGGGGEPRHAEIAYGTSDGADLYCGCAVPGDGIHASPQYAVGENGHTYVTGDQWVTATSPTVPGEQVNLYGVCATANNAWACGDDGVILKRVAHTGNWVAQLSGVETTLLRITFVDDNVGFCCGNSGVFLRTFDGGDTWEQPGKVQHNPSKFTNAVTIGDEDDLRGLILKGTLMHIASDKQIYVLDPRRDLEAQIALRDFELPNPNCWCEWKDQIALFGRFRNKPGVYLWNGTADVPKLISRSCQTELENVEFSNVYHTINFKLDSESDFTPTTNGPSFNTDQWTYLNGLLKLKAGATGAAGDPGTGALFFSHGDGAPISGQPTTPEVGGAHTAGGGGFYIKNITKAGFVNLELSLNQTVVGQSEPQLSLYVAMAPDDNGKPGTWGAWIPVYLNMQDIGWQEQWGRMNIKIPTVFTVHEWMKIKIEGWNQGPVGAYFTINRICLRALIGTDVASHASPCLVPFNDRLYCFFEKRVSSGGGADSYISRCLVLSEAGEQPTSSNHDYSVLNDDDLYTAIGCAVTHDDTLVHGSWLKRANPSPGPNIYYLVPHSNAGDISYVQQVTKGWEDFGNDYSEYGTHMIGKGVENKGSMSWIERFAGTSEKVATMRKDIDTLHLVVRPAPWRSSVNVLVEWWADDDNTQPQSVEIVSQEIDPATGRDGTRHELQLRAANVNRNNSGKRFKFRVRSKTSADQFSLVDFKIECRPVETPPTDYQVGTS